MKTWILVLGLAAIVIAAPVAKAGPADGVTTLSAASKKEARSARQVRRPAPRRVQPQRHVACTFMGCQPVPAGCYPVTQYNWNGVPTGFDAIACRR